jgi:hypothetical protein
MHADVYSFSLDTSIYNNQHFVIFGVKYTKFRNIKYLTIIRQRRGENNCFSIFAQVFWCFSGLNSF